MEIDKRTTEVDLMVSGMPKSGITKWTPERKAKWSEKMKKTMAEKKAKWEAYWNALTPEEQKKKRRKWRTINIRRKTDCDFHSHPKMDLDGAQECFGHLDQADCKFCPLVNTCASLKAAVGEATA